MSKKSFKQYIKIIYNNTPSIIINNFYRKPKMIINILLKPSIVWKESYFPELPHKNKYRILFDQLRNIILFTSIDEYYYMYGLDVKRTAKIKDYVIYKEFSEARNTLNLSNPHNDSTILRNKLFFEFIARNLGIPTPETIAYSEDGKLMLLKPRTQLTEDWNKLVNNKKGLIIYGKPIDGQCGAGILKIEVKDNYLIMNGDKVTIEDVQMNCNKGRYIFQIQLKQHPEMQKLYPESVNTIRLTTVRNIETNKIEILPPTLRIGAHGSFVDNFSKGGVIVAMDLKTGNLAEWGYFKPMYGFKSRIHPNSKIEFSSVKIPYYEDVKRMAILFHSFLNLHSIGWDIAITEKGPVFIEGNDNWEINLPQTFENPFKKEFKRLFKV